MKKIIEIFGNYLLGFIVGSLIILNIYFMIGQNNRVNSFMQKGARFTEADGQSLCLRVQELERILGIKKECAYGVSK